MSANLERIQIIGLYDTNKCIDVRISDNTLILVGENGSGKTNFLRILFNLLAGRSRELSLFSFKSAILTLDGEDKEIYRSDLNRLIDRSTRNNLPILTRSSLQQIREIFKYTEQHKRLQLIEKMPENMACRLII